MKSRHFHGGYYLAAAGTLEPGGRYRARVAVMALEATQTRFQRFLDFDLFSTEAEAEAHAVEAGKAWIDANAKQDASGMR